MRIQHNIMAMSAYRNYTNNVSAMKANLEKLSSGYKINRAGDDAAGLAISEKMRAQITGLETAQKNAKDGISLVQTAEGALTEVHDMLNRMVELATMSANGTYDNETDRAQLQKEMDQLTSEINRIADSSNFNGIKLLDGSMDGSMKVGTLTNLTSANAVADGAQSGGGGAQAGVYSIDLNDLTLKIGTTAVTTKVQHTGVDVEKTPAVYSTTKVYYDSNGNTCSAGAANKQSTTTVQGALKSPAVMTKGTTTTTLNGTQNKALTAGDITFQVGGADFEKDGATVTLGDKITDASKAGQQIAAALDGSTIEIDNITYDVKGENGKITLTAQSAPTTALTTKLDAVLDTDAAGNGTVEDQNNGWDQSVHVITPARAAGDDKLAQGKFTLTADMIKNGGALQIGKDAYVFQVGDSDPIDSGSGYTVIKLTEGLTGNDALKEAAQKLSQQNNQQFHITANEVDGEIRLTEKPGTVDYATEYDLHGTDGADPDAQDWKKVVQTGTLTKANANGKSLTLQIGDTAESFNQLKVNISDCHADALGIGSISIANQESAQAAVDAIKAAINYVSDVRGTLGATQNRLDHTINNLSVMTENIQDAESTIRDTDVAEEMMAYTKNNILIQSAQAMLAQANQVPQGVLQLLQ